MWVTVAAAVLMLASLGEPMGVAPDTPSLSLGDAAGVPTYVTEGETVTLTCTSTTPDIDSYQWYVNGMIITGIETQTYQFQVSYDDNFMEGADEYTCIALQDGEPPSLPSDPVFIFPLPQSPTLISDVEGEVESGTSVTFTCATETDGTFQYQFYRDGVNVTVASTSATYTTDPLTIDDSGVPWTCAIIGGPNGPIVSNSIQLSVFELPSSPTLRSSVAGDVEAGSSVTFTCATETEGEFIYDFLKDGGLVVSSRSGTFTINGLAVEDSGTWTCSITAFGTTLSSGSVRLSVTESEPDDTGTPLSFVAIRSSVIIRPEFVQPVLQAVALRIN